MWAFMIQVSDALLGHQVTHTREEKRRLLSKSSNQLIPQASSLCLSLFFNGTYCYHLCFSSSSPHKRLVCALDVMNNKLGSSNPWVHVWWASIFTLCTSGLRMSLPTGMLCVSTNVVVPCVKIVIMLFWTWNTIVVAGMNHNNYTPL